MSNRSGVQITCISVAVPRRENGDSVTAVIAVGGRPVRKQKLSHGALSVRCNFDAPCFLEEGLPVKIQVHIREKKTLCSVLKKPAVIEVSFTLQVAQQLLTAAITEVHGHELLQDPKICVDFERIADTRRAQVDATVATSGELKSMLDRLGKSQKLVENLLGFAIAASELHPIAKAIMTSVDNIYKLLQSEADCDASIKTLVHDIANTLYYISDVEQFARLAQLKQALKDVDPLIQDTYNLILKRSLHSGFVRILQLDAQGAVQALVARFSSFKQQFDRGVVVQTAGALEKLLHDISSNKDDTLLATLRPRLEEFESEVDECLQRTRTDVLDDIRHWVEDLDAQNIYWLRGFPGTGKSAIALTVERRLRRSLRLGSSFFFRRDVPTSHFPTFLWRSIAANLANRYPSVRRAIVEKLNEPDVDPERMTPDDLFKAFIADPLQATDDADIPRGRLPVIVIDGLDECGGLEGHVSPFRQRLLATLVKWSALPKRFKLFVTSRDEEDIRNRLLSAGTQSFVLHTGNDVNAVALEDIEIYLNTRFEAVRENYSLPHSWPAPSELGILVKAAAGLFIWAKTVAILIASGGPPRDQLDLVLRQIQKGGSGSSGGNLNSIYQTILDTSFAKADSRSRDLVVRFMGAVIVARTPVSRQDVQKLLKITSDSLQYVCAGLRSVLESGDKVRFIHQSFVDFLTDRDHCSTFRVDTERHQQIMALGCFQLFQKELCFNIGKFETSYLPNDAIPGLADRIDSSIIYASQFWPDHVVAAQPELVLLQSLQDFLHSHLLFWFEVLSIIKQVCTISDTISSLQIWAKEDNTVLNFLADVKCFVKVFGGVMSHSVPHIYLSALPFAPTLSVISRQYSKMFHGTLRLATGQASSWPVLQMVVPTTGVRSIAFSPDGKRIVSSGSQGIRVWNSETGADTGTRISIPKYFPEVTFSTDGQQITSVDRQQTIRWDAETGTSVSSFSTPYIGSQDYAVSHDGKRIATGEDNSDTLSMSMPIQIWDIESSTEVAATCTRCSGYFRFLQSGKQVAWGPRGSTEGVLQVWDIETGVETEILGPFEGLEGPFAFSLDGRRLAAYCMDKSICVWDTVTCLKVMDPIRGQTNPPYCITFSADGKRIASGSNNGISVWDTEQVAENGNVSPRLDDITAIALSSDGMQIASSSGFHRSSDHTIRICDINTGCMLTGPTQYTSPIWVVTFSPDGERIVSSSIDDTIRIWDTQMGICIADAVCPTGSSIAFSPNGERIVSVALSNGQVTIWNAKLGMISQTMLHYMYYTRCCVAFSPDAKHIIICSKDSQLALFDATTGMKMETWGFKGMGDLLAIAFSPGGVRVASVIIAVGDVDAIAPNGTIRVWDAKTGADITNPFHEDDMGYKHAAALSSNGKRIAIGKRDGRIRVRDVETGASISFQGHLDLVRSIRFFPDGKRIVSSSDDNTIRVLNIEVGDSHTIPLYPRVIFPPKIWLEREGQCNMRYSTFQHETGWVVGPQQQLLFWVPPEHRVGFCWSRTHLIIGECNTSLDLTKFTHGTSWIECHNAALK